MSKPTRRTGFALAMAGSLILAACNGVAEDDSAPTTSAQRGSDGGAEVSQTTFAVDPGGLDSDVSLIAAMTGQLLADGALQVSSGEAGCIATGMVEVIGALRLAEAGITVSDPNGPDDDPYALLSLDELGDVVAVWNSCADVGKLVTSALISTSSDAVAPEVSSCIEDSLRSGMGARFLLAALSNATGVDPAVGDVLRVLDGCTIGSGRPDLVDVDPALWPWLAVDLPGYSLSVIDTEGPDAAQLADFIAGVAAVDGIEAGTLRAIDSATGEVAAAMIVASVDSSGGGTIEVDDFVAGLVSAAGDLEVFEFVLPSGEEVIGWEVIEENLAFLVWAGERIVVFATGPVVAVEVLSLYTELVPSP